MKALALFAAVMAAFAATAAASAASAPRVQVSFTGRAEASWSYVEHWIYPNDNNECYARKTVDETSALGWTTAWTSVTLRPGAPAVPVSTSAQGTISGNEVRDYCDTDFAETNSDSEVPADWLGQDTCDAQTAVDGSGWLRVVPARPGKVVLAVQAPLFSNPVNSGCETKILADRLAAQVTIDLRKLAKAKALTLRVGGGAAGVDCAGQDIRYENYVIERSCIERVPWSGTLTLKRL